MTHACPDCGAPVSERAAVCPQCGFPIRRDALSARPGAPASGNRTLLIVALAVGGLFIVMMGGIFAAIVIPQFAKASRRMKEIEAESLLQRVYSLEQAYRQENGRFTAKLSDLPMARFATATARDYDVRVSAAGEDELCLEAVPKPAAGSDAKPKSMDQSGRLYQQAGCIGEPQVTGVLDTRREAQARTLVENGWHAVNAYRRAHGGQPPATLTELGPKFEAQASRADYRVEYFRTQRGGSCVAARPLSTIEGPERSVDQDGNLYRGSACAGSVIEHFYGGAADTVAADSANPR
jgi:Tfp pilus assembly protein PilE